MLTQNPHHPPPSSPLSWEVPWSNGSAGGITDDMETAKRHVRAAMRKAPKGAEGTIRRAYSTFNDGLRYGPVLVRIRRHKGKLLVEEPAQDEASELAAGP